MLRPATGRLAPRGPWAQALHTWPQSSRNSPPSTGRSVGEGGRPMSLGSAWPQPPRSERGRRTGPPQNTCHRSLRLPSAPRKAEGSGFQ